MAPAEGRPPNCAVRRAGCRLRTTSAGRSCRSLSVGAPPGAPREPRRRRDPACPLGSGQPRWRRSLSPPLSPRPRHLRLPLSRLLLTFLVALAVFCISGGVVVVILPGPPTARQERNQISFMKSISFDVPRAGCGRVGTSLSRLLRGRRLAWRGRGWRPKTCRSTPGGVWGVGGLAGARSRTRHRRWCARRRCVARQGMWRRRAVVCLAGMPGICRPDPRLGATREPVPPPGRPTVRLGAVGARCRRSSPPHSPPARALALASPRLLLYFLWGYFVICITAWVIAVLCLLVRRGTSRKNG